MGTQLAPLGAVIRPARSDDAEFLAALSGQVFQRYSDDAPRVMLRMMRNQASVIAVAEDRGFRLGFAVVTTKALGRDLGPWSQPSVAHLDAIAVRPTLAGNGLGRLLLAHAEEVARERGAVSMSLLTAETNKRAQRLFDRAGYHLLAPLEDVYTNGQRGFAMFKALNRDWPTKPL